VKNNLENNLDGLKQLVKLAIDVNVPQILKIKDDIEETTRQKKELQSQIDALNVDLSLYEEERARYEGNLLDLMEKHGMRKMVSLRYAVECCRNANPTIEIIDLASVPKRYIVETPRVDKRYIQSEYVNGRIIPPGVSIEYGQYLNIIERSPTFVDQKEKNNV